MTKIFDKALCVKQKYGKVTWFAPFVALAGNIEELSAVLMEASHNTGVCIIRGAVKADFTDCKKVNRRIHKRQPERNDDGTAHIEDVPRTWFLIDLDEVPEPEDFDWRTDPRRAAKWAVERYLPDTLQNVAFHFSHSSSAGTSPGLRLHLWFFLDSPADSASLKSYFQPFATALEARYGSKVLDLRLFNPVQPHYNACPVFEDPTQDPLAGQERQGLVAGDERKAAVTLSALPGDSKGKQKSESGLIQRALELSTGIEDLPGSDDLTLDELRAMMPFVIEGYTADPGHELWRKISTALKHHLISTLQLEDEDAFAFVDVEFNRKTPDYKPEMEDENRRQWSSLRIDLPMTGKGGQPTIATVIDIARTSGYESGRGSEARKPLSELVPDFVYCEDLKRFLRLSTGQLWDAEQMKNSLGFVMVDEKWIAVPHLMLHGKHRVRKVARPTYEPGTSDLIVSREGLQLVNTWRPGPVIPAQGDISLLLDHAAYIIPDERERGLLLDAMAFIVQSRGTKMQFAILIHGQDGTGKSWLAEILMLILGFHNCTEVENDELHNQFNDWIVNKELVFVNEMMVAEGKIALMNKLKPYITQSHIRVNTKGIARYLLPIPANFFLTSNHHNSIIIGTHDRRYMVLESPAERRPDDYYKALWAWSGDKRSSLTVDQYAHIAAAASYFQRRQLTNFNGLGKAPDTEGKRKLVEVSLPNLHRWVRDCIQAPEWPFVFDLISAELIAADAASLPPYVRGVSPHKLGDALRAAGACDIGFMLVNGSRKRAWAIRNIDQWKNATERERGFRFQEWTDLVQGVKASDDTLQELKEKADRAKAQRNLVAAHREGKPM